MRNQLYLSINFFWKFVHMFFLKICPYIFLQPILQLLSHKLQKSYYQQWPKFQIFEILFFIYFFNMFCVLKPKLTNCQRFYALKYPNCVFLQAIFCGTPVRPVPPPDLTDNIQQRSMFKLVLNLHNRTLNPTLISL